MSKGCVHGAGMICARCHPGGVDRVRREVFGPHCLLSDEDFDRGFAVAAGPEYRVPNPEPDGDTIKPAYLPAGGYVDIKCEPVCCVCGMSPEDAPADPRVWGTLFDGATACPRCFEKTCKTVGEVMGWESAANMEMKPCDYCGTRVPKSALKRCDVGCGPPGVLLCAECPDDAHERVQFLASEHDGRLPTCHECGDDMWEPKTGKIPGGIYVSGPVTPQRWVCSVRCSLDAVRRITADPIALAVEARLKNELEIARKDLLAERARADALSRAMRGEYHTTATNNVVVESAAAMAPGYKPKRGPEIVVQDPCGDDVAGDA